MRWQTFRLQDFDGLPRAIITADETGVRASDKLCWPHSAGTESPTDCHVDERRGEQGMIERTTPRQ